MLNVRPMTEDDLDRVMELEKAIFSMPWRRSFFISDINRPAGLCAVAESDANIVGYAVAWGGEEVHLANFAVVPEARRQGIGNRLINEVFDYARRRNAQSVYLEVRVTNAAARKFYADHGFVPTYLRKGYYENGEDAIIMEREVEPAAG